MNNQLEIELKMEMHYNENTKKCDQCQYFNEVENPHLDRDWIPVCTFNSIGNLTVKHSGTCRFWSPRVSG